MYFAYDTLTAGDLYTRTAPKENASSGTWITTYAFDPLHRPTNISYNDSYTPTKYFDWDVQSWWSGAPPNSPKGRLARQNANTCGTQCAGELYLYNVMGQIENKATWGPTNIGSGVDSSYTYNYAGGIAKEIDIWGNTYIPTYNSIGQMTQLASSISDATHPSPLYQDISYNPLGEVASETFGNGIVRTNSYDADGLT